MPAQLWTTITSSGFQIPTGVLDISLNALAISDTAAHNGQTFNTDLCNTVEFQLIWASGSTPAGTATVQESLDGGTTWTNTSTTASISGNTGSGIVKIVDSASPLTRLSVALTSGSATFTNRCMGKST